MTTTPRQHDALKCLDARWLLGLPMPTYREIAADLRIDKVSAWELVKGLIEKGFVRRGPDSIELVVRPKRHALQFPVVGVISRFGEARDGTGKPKATRAALCDVYEPVGRRQE